MTSKEAGEKVRTLTRQHNEINQRIAAAARAVVAVLLDAGRTNSAKPLQELFFEQDALEQEMLDFARDNTEAVVEAMMRALEDRQ